MTTSAGTTDSPSTEIVAKAGKSYRWRRYLMVLLLIAGGLWFLYDGYVGWPAHNRKLDEVEQMRNQAEAAHDQAKYDALSHQISRMHARYSHSSLFLQKLLGYTLPPIGMLFLIRMLYISRGAIRLKDDVITAPGHPPIRFTDIRELDKRQWDRKGIAIVKYEVAGRAGSLTLDDFVYEQVPTDKIYDRILAYVAPPAAVASEPEHLGNEEAQSM
jgi:hypothetical protein